MPPGEWRRVFIAFYPIVSPGGSNARRRLDDPMNGTNATYYAALGAQLAASALDWLREQFEVEPLAGDVVARASHNGVELNVTVWTNVTDAALQSALMERSLALTLCLTGGWCGVESDANSTMAPVELTLMRVFDEDLPSPAALPGCPPTNELCRICPSFDSAGKIALAGVLGCPNLVALCLTCTTASGGAEALTSGGGQALTSGDGGGGLDATASVVVLFFFICLLVLVCVLVFLLRRARRAKQPSQKFLRPQRSVHTQTDGLEPARLPAPRANYRTIATPGSAQSALLAAVVENAPSVAGSPARKSHSPPPPPPPPPSSASPIVHDTRSYRGRPQSDSPAPAPAPVPASVRSAPAPVGSTLGDFDATSPSRPGQAITPAMMAKYALAKAPQASADVPVESTSTCANSAVQGGGGSGRNGLVGRVCWPGVQELPDPPPPSRTEPPLERPRSDVTRRFRRLGAKGGLDC